MKSKMSMLEACIFQSVCFYLGSGYLMFYPIRKNESKITKSGGTFVTCRKGGFNVPFCKKPNRFAQALVTKITNQVKNVSKIIELGDFTFKHQDFKATLKEIKESDLVYSAPPYIGRHVDYFDSWSEEEEILLNNGLVVSKAKYVLSTWLSNKYRTNEYIFSIWKDSFISTKEHFYHVGGKEKNRNSVNEALLSNVQLKNSIPTSSMKLKMVNRNLPPSKKNIKFQFSLQ